MYFKIVDAKIWAWCIELANAVQTPDARVKHVSDIFLRLSTGEGDGLIGGEADGGVAHYTFESVLGVALLQLLESLEEPGWRIRLLG